MKTAGMVNYDYCSAMTKIRHLNLSSYRKAGFMSLVTKYSISTFITEEKIIKSVVLRREHYSENGGSTVMWVERCWSVCTVFGSGTEQGAREILITITDGQTLLSPHSKRWLMSCRTCAVVWTSYRKWRIKAWHARYLGLWRHPTVLCVSTRANIQLNATYRLYTIYKLNRPFSNLFSTFSFHIANWLTVSYCMSLHFAYCIFPLHRW